MAECGADTQPFRGYRFLIPLEDTTKDPCPEHVIRSLFGQFQKDIPLVKEYYSRCLPFVKPSSVSLRDGDKTICFEFIVNDMEELGRFREYAKELPSNIVSNELRLFMNRNNYQTRVGLPKNVQFCLHMSKDVYNEVKESITTDQNQESLQTYGNLGIHDGQHGTFGDHTSFQLKDLQGASLTRTFLVHVPEESDCRIKDVFLCIESKKYKMTHLTCNMYTFDINKPGYFEYSYSVTYTYNRDLLKDNRLKVKRSKSFQCTDKCLYRDKLWNEEAGLQAHLLYIIKMHLIHTNVQELCTDIESVCQGANINLSIDTFLNELIDYIQQNNMPYFGLAIIIGNVASKSMIDRMQLNPSDAARIAAELSARSLDMFPTSCTEYMPAVCHQLFRTSFKEKISCVAEIKYFSSFLGKHKFCCIDKYIQQHLPLVKTSDSTEEFYILYKELVMCYLQDNWKYSLSYVKKLLQNVPVIFSVFVMKNREAEGFGDEEIKKVSNEGFHGSVEMALSSAFKTYDIDMLISYWNELCKYEEARNQYKSTFEENVTNLLDKLLHIAPDTLCKFLDERNGLFEDDSSQKRLLKSLAESRSEKALLLFKDLHSKKKFTKVYSFFSVDVFITWLDNAKTFGSNIDDRYFQMFVDVLEMTYNRKDIQTEITEHVTVSMSCPSVEQVSLWINYKGIFERHPQAGEVFIRNVLIALKKDTTCKPLDILQKLLGCQRDLNVATRWSVQIVSTFLDVFCPLNPVGTEKDLFTSVMQHIDIWEIVVCGNGQLIKSIHNTSLCQSVFAIFINLSHCVLQKRMSYEFCKIIEQNDKIEAVSHILNKLVDLRFAMEESNQRLNALKVKMECVVNVLERILERFSTETLPDNFTCIITLYKKQLEKLTKLDLSDIEIEELCHGTESLTELCSKLDILSQSQMFWNVYEEIICEQKAPLCSTRTLYAQNEPFKQEFIELNMFLELLLQLGKEAYIITVGEIENSFSMNIERIKVIFKNVSTVEELEKEKKLAECFLQRDICEDSFQELRRLAEIYILPYACKIVDGNKLNNISPTFLNRCETLLLSDRLSSKQKNVKADLEVWISKLANVGDKRFDENDLFPIYNTDLLASLVLKIDTGSTKDVEGRRELVKRCKTELVCFMTSDAVLRLSLVCDSNMFADVDSIRKTYFEKPIHGGLLEFYEWDRRSCKDNLLRIVFTFASVHSKTLCLLKGKDIQTEYIGAFKSQTQLYSRFQHFWFRSSASLLCMQCSVEDDGKHVSLIMSIIERYRIEFMEQYPNRNKHVYLIIHISRMMDNSAVSHINFLSNWRLATLDIIERPRVQLPRLCEQTLIHTFKDMRPLYKQIKAQLSWSFTRIKYSASGRSVQSIQKLVKKMKSCDQLLEIIDQILWTTISCTPDTSLINDWQVQVAFDRQLLNSSSGMVDALEMFLGKQIQSLLASMMFNIEVHGVLDSFLKEDIETSRRRMVWKDILLHQNVFDISGVLLESGPGCYKCFTPDYSFRTPFFKHMYEIVEERKIDFLKTISVLKVKLRPEEEDLPEEIINDVIRAQQYTIVKSFPRICPMYSYLSYDYLDDFCNVLSYSCVGIAHKSRTHVAKQLVLQKTNLNVEDFFEVVLKLHSTVWLNPCLFSTEMQILSIYSEVFHLDLSGTLQASEQVGGNMPEKTLGEIRNQLEPSHDLERTLEDGEQVGGNKPENMLERMVMSGINSLHEPSLARGKISLNEEDGMDSDNLQDQSFEPKTYNEKGLDVDLSNDINFVRDICKNMLHCCTTMKLFKNNKYRWSNTTGRLLPLLPVVSNEPIELDMLRFCHGICEHLILPLEIEDTVFFTLAEVLFQCGKFLHEDVFQCVLRVIKGANGKSIIECQRVIADYMMKGLTHESSNESLRYLYKLVTQSDLPDRSCSFLKMVVESAIEDQIIMTEEGIILQILLYDDDLKDTLSLPFFENMDKCLRELSSQGRVTDPFIILLTDIFEEKYLMHFRDDDHDASTIFLTAHNIIQQDTMGVRLIASIGCYKAMLKHAMLECDVKPEFCDTLNTIFTHEGTLSQTLPFFNYLRGKLTSHGLNKRVTALKPCLPSLKTQFSPLLLESYLDSSPLILEEAKLLKLSDKTDDESIKILLEHVTMVDGLLNIYHVLLKEYYIPQTYRALTDTQKQSAKLFATHIEKHDALLEPFHRKFMVCLLGRTDFKVETFMHTSESSPRQCLNNIILTYLYSILLSYQHNDCLSLLQTCICEPLKLRGMFLPGFQHSEDSSLYGLGKSKDFIFTSCACRNRVYLERFQENATCFVCGQILDIKLQSFSKGNVEQRKGWQFSVKMQKCEFDQASLSLVACNLLFFLLKGCLLGSYALGISDSKSLEEVLGVPEIDIGIQECLNLECHWENLLQLLNLEDYHLFILMQSFIYENKRMLCSNLSSLKTCEDRDKWEKCFSNAVEKMTLHRFDLMKQVIRQRIDSADVELNDFEACIGEFNELEEKNKITLFRMTAAPNVENFKVELSFCTSSFPFLRFVIHKEIEIKLVSSLYAIIQWHLTVVSATSYLFKRNEILKMSVHDFVYHDHCKNHQSALKKRFNILCLSWNSISSNTQFDSINWTTQMSKCLIVDENSQLFQGLNFLASIQNNVIQLAMSMAFTCRSLQVFAKSTNGQVIVPEAKVLEINEDMLMKLPRSIKDIVLQEAQCDHRYGYGRRVLYNFLEIEKSLVRDVLVGKVFIKVDLDLLPKVAFTDELYRKASLLIQDIRSSITQENLSTDIQNGTRDLHEKNPKMVSQLLIHIGMMLPLLKKTKGDTEETVEEYVKKWKNLLASEFPLDLLPSRNMKLCHIIGLYELLEELNADLVVDGLGEEFRVQLAVKEKQYYSNIVEKHFAISEILLKALNKFIHRFLSHRESETKHKEADTKLSLHNYLSDSSLWPNQFFCQGYVVVGDERCDVVSMVPDCVTVGHICDVVSVLKDNIQGRVLVERIMENKKQAPIRTLGEKSKRNLKQKRKY